MESQDHVYSTCVVFDSGKCVQYICYVLFRIMCTVCMFLAQDRVYTTCFVWFRIMCTLHLFCLV